MGVYFGAKLGTALDRAKVTQDDIAAAFGISQQQVSKWVTGKAEPGIKRATLLAQLLSVPRDEVLEWMADDAIQENEDTTDKFTAMANKFTAMAKRHETVVRQYEELGERHETVVRQYEELGERYETLGGRMDLFVAQYEELGHTYRQLDDELRLTNQRLESITADVIAANKLLEEMAGLQIKQTALIERLLAQPSGPHPSAEHPDG